MLVSFQHLVVGVNEQAADDGRKSHTELVGHHDERRGVDGAHERGVLAEVVIGALGTKLVVAIHRFLHGCGVQLVGARFRIGGHGGAGLLDGVALVEPLAVRGVDLRVDGLPLRNLVLPLRVHDGVQVARLGVAAGLVDVLAHIVVQVALHGALAHKALALGVHQQMRRIHTAHAGVMDHLGVRRRLNLAAGPHTHLVAVAGAVHLAGRELLDVGAVVSHHLQVALVVARSQNDALASVEQHILAVLLAHHAGHAAGLVGNELLGRAAEEELHPRAFGNGGDGFHHLVVADAEVGVGVQVHVVAVDVQHAVGLGLIGIHLDAAGGRGLAEPGQRLEGVVGPGFQKSAVAAVVGQLDEIADKGLLACFARLVQIDASGHVALGGRRGLALHTGNLGTSFSGRHGGSHARDAGAHDDDLKVARLIELRNGFRRDEEAGRTVGSARRARAGIGHRRALRLRRAPGQRSSGSDGCSEPAELEQTTPAERAGGGTGDMHVGDLVHGNPPMCSLFPSAGPERSLRLRGAERLCWLSLCLLELHRTSTAQHFRCLSL